MKAAVVERFGSPPACGQFRDPVAEDGEILVAAAAAAVSPLVKSVAAGRHYSSTALLPFVPGVDGVGRLPDGKRVYFAFPRSPFGTLAASVPVREQLCVPVPDDVDDVTAAAIANPAMSSWAALTVRARFVRGEAVLVNGATGVAGRLAVQIAKYLGASAVIATGRNPAVLEQLPALGADVVIRLDASASKPADEFRRTIEAYAVRVVLDYLWGTSAEELLAAIAASASPQAAPRIRFVQIGASSGPEISLHGATLRSSGVELLGSGIGSVAPVDLVAGVAAVLRAVAPAGLRISAKNRPLDDVEAAWNEDPGDRRLVFTL